MSYINVEIKARTIRAAAIREYLLEHGAEFKGKDLQTDTYFRVERGRLKLRSGQVENNLIHYFRPDKEGPKESVFTLVAIHDSEAMKQLLTDALGVLVEVKKEREIYYIDNVKFHLDTLGSLGNFVEIEAGNKIRPLSLELLHEQCNHYKAAFEIADGDLVNVSYSDMLLTNSHGSLQQKKSSQ